jgi:hypothetical protein
MSRIDFCVSRWPLVIVAAILMLSTSGCVGIAAQLMYMAGAGDMQAEFDELEGKRVAVICVSNRSSYGSGAEAEALARLVSAILRKEVKKIEMVSHTEVANWKDTADWDEIDYRAVGRGVKADMLIAIDVQSMSYFEGQTLYKGRANYSVTVYDMTKGGKVAWSKDNPDFQFPVQGGRPVTDMVEAKFQKDFLTMLSIEIARSFHSYDKITDVGKDAAFLD